ncbi:hemicentin-1-like isoform X2 [Stylophora pistillata]|uniref:hemicentin-1-like isoform X2 n=1 Tax=Stylophora pistillata TaxID=50429 RepID=UPI000C03910B|nr:hemicentin-1-like isoform X2 [Stylophora pistillata]
MICHLKIIFVWISLVPQLTDGGSVTWYEPTPAKTTSNQNEVLPPGRLQVYEGSSAVLQWNFSLTSNIGFTFIKFKGATVVTIRSDGKAGDVSANFTGRLSVLSSTKQTAALSISRVIFADDKANGEFTCEVLTLSNERWKRAIQVQVLAPVKITDQVRGDQVVPKGGNLHLFCKVTGRPAPNVNWTKVPADGSNEIKHYGPTWNFTNINVTDSGTYSCVANNKVEDPVRGQAVKVIVVAPVSIADTENKFIVTVGEIVTLNCKAKGNLPLSYTWTPCSEVQVCDMETLDTPPVNKDVNFTCKAADEFTDDSKSYIVFIGGTVINITLVITSESCTDGEYDRSTLLGKLNKTFNDVLADKFGLLKMKLNNVRCGSLKVDLALNFNSTTKEIDVITELRKAVKDGKLGEFTVSSIDGTRDDEGTTSKVPTTPKSSSNMFSSFPVFEHVRFTKIQKYAINLPAISRNIEFPAPLAI